MMDPVQKNAFAEVVEVHIGHPRLASETPEIAISTLQSQAIFCLAP